MSVLVHAAQVSTTIVLIAMACVLYSHDRQDVYIGVPILVFVVVSLLAMAGNILGYLVKLKVPSRCLPRCRLAGRRSLECLRARRATL